MNCRSKLRVGHLLVLACVAAAAQQHDPIDLSGFRDSVGHWERSFGRDRHDSRYQPTEIIAIADNLLRYQHGDGGWPKNIDWLAIIDPAEVEALLGDVFYRSTFDNRNTYTQIEYLTKVYTATGEPRFREAAWRGLDYILAEQRPSGGVAGLGCRCHHLQ